MSAYGFFPTDLLMDLGALAVVQLAFGGLRPLRLLAAQGVLCAGTLMMLAANERPPLLLFCLAALSSAIASGERRPGRILEGCICMICAAAAAAGFAALGLGAAFVAVGILTFMYLLRRRRHAKFRWNAELSVERDGVCDTLPVLIDTGNRLHEPVSGLPVLIAEAAALPSLAAHARSLPEEQFRTLPFGALGSRGELRCFRASRAEFIIPGKGRQRAPTCWIGLYPGRIPGSVRALAPAEFAQALQDDPAETFQAKLRRFCYGVFKRETIHLRHGGTDSTGFRVLHRRKRPPAAAADP